MVGSSERDCGSAGGREENLNIQIIIKEAKMKQRIFISIAQDYSLSDEAIAFKWRLVRHIEWLGFIPELFLADHHITESNAMHQSWTLENLKNIVLKCSGAIIVGLKRKTGEFKSEFNQIEGLEIIRSGIPFIILADPEIPQRGVFYQGNGFLIHYLKDLQWKHTQANTTTNPKLSHFLKDLRSKVERQKHVFVGYCSQSDVLFKKLHLILAPYGITVVNWQTDFQESSTILEQINEASRRTLLGIFLFTKDDMKDNGEFLPRDNVIFEAGFFTHAKGRDRVLIIKEEGTKMPVDLDGLIYINVKDKNNLDDVKDRILNFVKERV